WALRVLIFWTLVAVLISRVLVSYGLLQLVPQMRRSWMDVVRMAGVRGAISLALALSIPSSVPQARLVVDATFVVVVVTLLVGALTYERRVIAMDLRGG
ncbi:MAG TPA: cation:proton antiporter, partial [Candidatus Baltobacteraceae bacterium]|nr:cation:proton antiporter [Candidatus Baltobacteraceae bacterium]